ncbi:hypothetical protein K503DRAFT_855178 [Rhizopogon vinicolor AM-OR11-026]|uniref:Uncharacterized protein n=1 Tax=Rhizopogon vinicolor AM-OR11-026 TaxID=1314800 RepID=A0A1B7N778_9AGAM|nr:hypothetical protein K503DRAFT_855178 [Rhizopogon vinicolor AM-OR11-026]
MSNLPKCPLPLTKQVTIKKAFRIIGAGITAVILVVAVIFIHLGSTIPALKPYANYTGYHKLVGRPAYFVGIFLFGSSWWFRQLVAVAPRQGESESLTSKKLTRKQRISYATLGACNTCNGLGFVFLSRRAVDFSTCFYVSGLLTLGGGVCQIYIAYIGRVPTKDNKKTVDNNDSQPASEEVITGNVNNNVLSKVFMI